MRKISIFLSTILFLGIALCFAQEESITITTYYPSPYGSYNELRTYSNTYLATDSGSVGIGTTSLTSPSVKLHVTGGDINVDNNRMVGLAEPSVASDGATKNYVDVQIANLQAQIDTLETKITGGAGQQLFTSSGDFKVPTGVTTVRVTLVGGGGGGGAGASTGGARGGDGENGGSSSFGSYLSVTGGSGGQSGSGTGGGRGGSGGSPAGSRGSNGSSCTEMHREEGNPYCGYGGAGGSGYEGYGTGGAGGSGGWGGGVPGGGGGGGGGAGGFIQARQLTSLTPGATISVTVGGGGGGGSKGPCIWWQFGCYGAGKGGGGGASGFVRVEWQ